VPQQVIPILRVADAARAIEWYDQLGFSVEWIHRFEEHLPAFVSLSRGQGRIYLSEHEGDASPDTLLYLRHSELDELAETLGAEFHHVPWGRELHVQDPDGNRLRISDPIDD
jgi:catechol 2,3-dioxygenase-like lactoylglutathione lyase family enzyme